MTELEAMRESATLWRATAKRLLAENQRLIQQNERPLERNRAMQAEHREGLNHDAFALFA
jgi:hypothetical protein